MVKGEGGGSLLGKDGGKSGPLYVLQADHQVRSAWSPWDHIPTQSGAGGGMREPGVPTVNSLERDTLLSLLRQAAEGEEGASSSDAIFSWLAHADSISLELSQ